MRAILAKAIGGAVVALLIGQAGPAAASAGQTAAQPDSAPYTPGRGDPLRKAILDAVRPEADRELGAPVAFVAREFNVLRDWAFVALEAQRPGGRAIDPVLTPFALRNGEDALDMFDCCHVEAVLKREPQGWRVLEAGVGTTDVWYTAWCDRVPSGLIGICASLKE